MRKILNIITVPDESFATEIARVQKEDPTQNVTVVNLTEPDPDYNRLLHEIFDADSIQVW